MTLGPTPHESDSYGVHIAGEFAHEIRNALSPASLMMQMLCGGPEADTGDTYVELDRRCVEALGVLFAKDELSHAEILLGRATLEAMQERRPVIDESLPLVLHALERGIRVSRQMMDFVQAGNLKIGDDKVSLTAIVAGVLEACQPAFEANAIRVHVELPANLQVCAKESHVYSMVRNLVDNACDALSKEGLLQRELRIEASCEAQCILLRVQDSGRGIAQDVHERIFEPFFSTKGAQGAGLGLSLSRRLAQAYGGSLEFSRDVRQGAVFSLRLPKG